MKKWEEALRKVMKMCILLPEKRAAMYNERLYSREGAAELLGISVSTLADYELGNTKVVPVDKVVLMADLYNAPELKTGYCKHECPICSYLPVATEAKGLEGITLLFLVVGEANPRTGGSRKERTCMQAERTG
ncbi:helix-turn-helix domain-containing protein [Blautia sp. NSJ-166]|uniref:helix-turn-helix domain-containing protein n=1 Tax=Blautia sp. NSJ-166 TaxID=2931882 RepID=UPI001FD31DD9|nr:helix-turn-helix domain-containing protein [Blautia sp. NSJ-166]